MTKGIKETKKIKGMYNKILSVQAKSRTEGREQR